MMHPVTRSKSPHALAAAVLALLAFLAQPLSAAVPSAVKDNTDASVTFVGAYWGYSSEVSSYRASARWSNSAGDTATYQLTGLAPTEYQVFLTWPRADDPEWYAGRFRPAALPVNVYDGTASGALVGQLHANEQLSPSGLNYDGQDWTCVGAVTITGDKMAVKLIATGGGQTTKADGVAVVPTMTVKDNADAGVTFAGAWDSDSTCGYGGTNAAAGDDGATATYQFDDLLPGRYHVYLTWPDADEPSSGAGASRSAAARVRVYDGTAADVLLDVREVNQSVSPSGLSRDGTNFTKACTVDITGDRMAVRIVATGSGATVADAVLVRMTTDPLPPAQTPTLSLGEPEVFDYNQLTLVDEVNCGDANDPHAVYESAPGVSVTTSLLDSLCRVLPNTGGEPAYFGYRIGQGRGLQAGKAYVLVVEYPEDESRSMVVVNHGCETNVGFHTGTSVGDATDPLYVGITSESMKFGLTGQYRKWQQLFHLHDRFPEIQKPRSDEAVRPYLPQDGFYVMIARFAAGQDPTSAGPAVRRIALYEAPSLAGYTQPLAELPEGLPKRRLFWREEMADGVIQSNDPARRGVTRDVDWYEYKARLHKLLGMNTFAKDLLEFGHNQGWDASVYNVDSDNWYWSSSCPNRWDEILTMLSNGNYGLSILPYYEYVGGDGPGPLAIGAQKRCEPLKNEYYTNLYWLEGLNVDVSDPAAVTDATHLLEQTITALYQGNRPVPKPSANSGIAAWTSGQWGYVDFGVNWQNVRISQTWTQSRLWHGADASPLQQIYWHSTYSGFSGDTVPQGAVRETTLNFITKHQYGNYYHWTKDVDVTASPITPRARYMVMRCPSPVSQCMEFLFVGYINGQGTKLRTIPVTAGSANGFYADYLFDNQTEFNSSPPLEVVGAWLRPRLSAMPMGFAEGSTLLRFSADMGISPAVTKAALVASPTLLQDYYDWWYGQRKEFLNTLRDYLRSTVDPDCVVLYSWDPSEPGATHRDNPPDVVTDDPDTWAGLVERPMSYTDAIDANLHYEAMTLPIYNWDPTWMEWEHSTPRGDAGNYRSNDGVMMEYVYNDLYTVGRSDALEAYRTGSGLACIRHFALNENMMTDSAQTELLGYFVAHVELAGPYCMMGEARALANGNPYYFGYLSPSSFNRGFPGYAREFNANFLALPALPMTTLGDAASRLGVVVRSITTPGEGTWLAIINTTLEDQGGVDITLPASGAVTDAVTGQPVDAGGGKVTLDLWPGQLKTLHIDSGATGSIPGDFNGDGAVTHADYTVWADTFGFDGSPGKEDMRADGNGDGRITHADYTIWADHFGQTAQVTVAQPAAPATTAQPATPEPLDQPAVTAAPDTKAQARAERRAARLRVRQLRQEQIRAKRAR